jgi:glycosyltransferase involved in cell wall biosynthesis
MFYLPGLRTSSAPLVHLVNPMRNPNGGSENRVLELFKHIARLSPAKIWSDREFSEELGAKAPIAHIHAPLSYPRGGNLVFVGAYYKIGPWAAYARPKRVVVLHNTPHEFNLHRFLQEMKTYGLRDRLEIVYASDWLRTHSGIDGVVHQSPIDTLRFCPKARPPHERFTVGRLSRDIPEKHHPDDPALWKQLARMGYRVRLMGATCLRDQLPACEHIELLPAGAEPAEAFLQSLDAFVYRTNHVELFETFGRVVSEAMLCGVPVVCGKHGGYCEVIAHGETGFIFDTNEEAVHLIEQLRAHPDLARTTTERARASMIALHCDAALEKMAKFYV